MKDFIFSTEKVVETTKHLNINIYSIIFLWPPFCHNKYLKNEHSKQTTAPGGEFHRSADS